MVACVYADGHSDGGHSGGHATSYINTNYHIGESVPVVVSSGHGDGGHGSHGGHGGHGGDGGHGVHYDYYVKQHFASSIQNLFNPFLGLSQIRFQLWC